MKNFEKIVLFFTALSLSHTLSWGQSIMLQQVMDAYVNDTLIPAYSGGVQPIIWPHPALADIDCDGDFDLFVGYGSGRIMFFRNAGDSHHYQFVLETNNYGSINVGSSAAPAFYDIDNDGDLDLFIGNGFDGGYGGNIAFYENTGNACIASWVLKEDTLAGLDAWDHGVPTVADVDGDGDGDLLVGGGYGGLFFSQNIGTPDSAIWATPISYNTFNGIYAVGFKATPHLCDMNCDGKPDLLIGNDTGKMFFYKNMGSINGVVQWQQVTNIYTGVDFTHLDYTSPAVADLDGDGDKDILESEHYGNINLFMNAGDSCNFIPNWVTGDLLSGTIDVGQDAFPALVDIDGDCDLDLFLGKANGQIRFYRNAGTDDEPNWVLVTENFLGFDTGGTGTNSSKPFFADYDFDGDQDLFIGTESYPRKVWYFENKSDSTGLMFEFVSNDFFANFNSLLNSSTLPMLADFNNDSHMDCAFPYLPNMNDSIIIIYNSGLPNPWSMTTKDTIPAGQIIWATALDYDYDGDAEFLLKGITPMWGLWILRNISNSSNWALDSLLLTIPTFGDNFTIVDVDNDFAWDIVGGFANGGIKFWKNTTSWSKFAYQADKLTVAFQDSSFSGATEWFWDFGDGTTSTEHNPSHTYIEPGAYEVCLTIKNGCKESKTCQTIKICAAPIADFSFQQNDLFVSYQNTSIWEESITWDFGDATTSNETNPTHTYAAGGSFTVCLTAQNDCGADTFCNTVTLTVGTNAPQKPDWAPVVFPNPGVGRIFIDWRNAGAQDGMLTIHDLLGRQICQMKKETETQMIWEGKDANGIPVNSGIYLFRFAQGGAVWFEKVLIVSN